VYCPLTDTQAKAYRNLTESDIFRKLSSLQDSCECGSGAKSSACCSKGSGLTENIFPIFVLLAKLSNHLALLIPAAETQREKQEKELEWLKLALPGDWERLHRSGNNILNLANSNFCGKWNVLRRLLALWYENRDKVLVFSRSVRLLRMLRLLFTSTTSYSVSLLDGTMSYDERTAAVNDFNDNPDQFVFLISIGAGGVGLNITSANKVIIVDPHWNPSQDLQAQDRAYRIGQQRDVEVFRLVSAGTIEEVVYARQVYKQQMANIAFNASHERRYFDGVQYRKEQKGEIFGLKNLLAYGENLKVREIFNRTNIAETKIGLTIADMNTQEQDDEPSSDDDSSVRVKGEEYADSAMLKIVAEVTSELTSKRKRTKEVSKKKTNGEVEWILTQAGIKYSHENSEVMGGSKVESALSRRALEGSKDVEGDRQPVFAATSGAMAQGPAEIKFRPSEDVCKRQFCSIARHFGFSDATKLALAVESWTPEERRNRLDDFYKARRRGLVDAE
jgi:superfamily II DNA/RNA helicase